MKPSIVIFMEDELAATSIEYALIATGISVAILAGVQLIGGSLNAFYQAVGAALAQ